jgi:uncharacterized protein YndB with AHSA1/START domain
MNPVDTMSLRVERTFDAPAEDVFDAWTNPEVLKRWWSVGPTWNTPTVEVDLRVGGSYRLSMENPESGARYTVIGEYREVDSPKRLVYTWAWESEGGQAGDAPASDPHVSLVSVQFLQEGEQTKVVLEHAGLASQESAVQHEAGWIGCLENLDARIFAEASRS